MNLMLIVKTLSLVMRQVRFDKASVTYTSHIHID